MAFIKCYDDNLNIIGDPIHDLNLKQARKRINHADYATFGIPFSSEGIEQLNLAQHVIIYDGAEEAATGVVENRDMSKNEYSFTVQGHANRMKGFKTPDKWQSWNHLDLADVIRDHTNQFKIKRWNTPEDWGSVIKHQVDTELEPGAVILEYEPHPDDPENERPKTNGYVQMRVDLGENALDYGRIMRWSEVVDPYVRITIQSRSANTESELNNANWGPEMTAINVGDVQENEIRGVVISGAGRWVDIRINLSTEDIESVRKGPNGEVVGYGFTPYLEGAELIWREPTFLSVGEIPLQTGTIVQGYEFNRVDFLRTLKEICEDYGWEFTIRHDEKQGKILLDLGEEGSRTIGKNRAIGTSDPVVLEHGRNIDITTLRDNKSRMANVLNCFGAGEGSSQIYKELRDEQSIKDYGEIPDDFVFSEAETLTQLIEAGQAELAKRSKPETVFEVQIPSKDLQEIKLGDRITVVHPRNRVIVDGRVHELNRTRVVNRETVKMGINDFLFNPMEKLIGKEVSNKTLGELAPPPKQILALEKPDRHILSWGGTGDSFAIRYRKDGGNWVYTGVTNNEFTNYVTGNYEYQLAAIKNGQIGAWSESVWTVKSVIKKPIITDSGGVARGVYVVLDMPEEEGWGGFELHVSDQSNFTPNQSTFKMMGRQTAFQYISEDFELNKTYYIRVVAYDIVGDKSEPSNQVVAQIRELEKGPEGVGISDITEYYARHTSGTSAPTSGWSNDVPTLTTTYKYLWNYEKVTFTNNTTSETNRRVIGVYGDKGTDGIDGRGISDIINYYLATNQSSGVTRNTSGWTTSVQITSATNRYLWNYEKIEYTSGNPTYTEPTIIGSRGVDGKDGARGPAGPGFTFRGKWTNGEFYYGNEMRRDLVQGSDDKYYICKLNHFAENGNKPITGGAHVTYWEYFDEHFESVATKLLLADDAIINGIFQVLHENGKLMAKIGKSTLGGSLEMSDVEGNLVVKIATDELFGAYLLRAGLTLYNPIVNSGTVRLQVANQGTDRSWGELFLTDHQFGQVLGTSFSGSRWRMVKGDSQTTDVINVQSDFIRTYVPIHTYAPIHANGNPQVGEHLVASTEVEVEATLEPNSGWKKINMSYRVLHPLREGMHRVEFSSSIDVRMLRNGSVIATAPDRSVELSDLKQGDVLTFEGRNNAGVSSTRSAGKIRIYEV